MNDNAFNGKFMTNREGAETDTERFRHYLEQNGVLDAWTRILTKLWTLQPKERPPNPLAYITKELGGVVAGPIHARNKIIDELRHRVITLEGEAKIYSSRNEELLNQIEELEKIVADKEEIEKQVADLEEKGG